MNKSDKKNIVAIIQARMGSQRLHEKMMVPLNGIPIIQWVIERSIKSTLVDQFVVAIPDTVNNDILYNFLEDMDVNIYQGSEHNLVKRYFEAAILYKASDVVRICADRPLISPEEIDNLIQFYIDGNYDYAYNHIPIKNKYPIGFGAEICSMSILNKIYREASESSHLEHLFNYIIENSKSLKIGTFDPPNKNLWRPELKFDVDTSKDLFRLKSIGCNINDSPIDIINKKDK